MANEISLQVQLSFAKGGLAAVFDSGDVSITMTGTKYIKGRQSIPITDEVLVLGEVPAGLARLAIRNMDSTNYVFLKPATTQVATIVIMPGEATVITFAPLVGAPALQANVAAVDIEYLLIQA